MNARAKTLAKIVGILVVVAIWFGATIAAIAHDRAYEAAVSSILLTFSVIWFGDVVSEEWR